MDDIPTRMGTIVLEGGHLHLRESRDLWAPYNRNPTGRLLSLVHSKTQRAWGYVIYEIVDPVRNPQACLIALGSALCGTVQQYATRTICIAALEVFPRYQQRGLATLLVVAALSRGVDAINNADALEATHASDCKCDLGQDASLDSLDSKHLSDSQCDTDKDAPLDSNNDVSAKWPAVVDARSEHVRRILVHLGFVNTDRGRSAYATADVAPLLARHETAHLTERALSKLEESRHCCLWRVLKMCRHRWGS